MQTVYDKVTSVKKERQQKRYDCFTGKTLAFEKVFSLLKAILYILLKGTGVLKRLVAVVLGG